MGRKFCPKCGKPTEEFYNGLCESCSLSKFSVTKDLPENLVVKECKSCGKFFIDKPSDSIESSIELFLEDLLKEKEILAASYRIVKGKVYLTLRLKKGETEKTEEKSLNLILKKIICQTCSMKESGYFQSTLQVRAPENLLPAIKDDIEKQINHLNKYDKLAFISKFQEIKNGFDLLIGSKNSAKEIANSLKIKYGAKSKITRKLSGSISGKKVYRDTIIVRVE